MDDSCFVGLFSLAWFFKIQFDIAIYCPIYNPMHSNLNPHWLDIYSTRLGHFSNWSSAQVGLSKLLFLLKNAEHRWYKFIENHDLENWYLFLLRPFMKQWSKFQIKKLVCKKYNGSVHSFKDFLACQNSVKLFLFQTALIRRKFNWGSSSFCGTTSFPKLNHANLNGPSEKEPF